MRIGWVAVMWAAWAALGCSSSANPAGNTAADAGADAAIDMGPAATADLKLHMHVDVPAGQEIFRCQLIRLPAKAPTDGGAEIFVNGYSHDYTAGSHHYLVFRTTLTSIAPGLDAPFDCAEGGGVMKNATGYVFGGQVPHASAMYPSGVAIPLNAGEIVALQAHYINAGTTAIAADIDITLRTIAGWSVAHRAGMLRMYDPFIYVPPHATTAKAQMRCPIPRDVTIIGASPHMHARGVKHTSWLDLAPTVRATTPLNVSTDWEHPTDFIGPLDVKAGSFLRMECDYSNATDQTFYQGQSAANNEMCMLSAIYYPALPGDEKLCYDSDGFGSGTLSCADATTCIAKCPAGEAPSPSPGQTALDVGPCWQQCMTNTCPNAAGALITELTCIGKNCATECAAGGSACTSCAMSKCSTETIGCQAKTCGPLD